MWCCQVSIIRNLLWASAWSLYLCKFTNSVIIESGFIAQLVVLKMSLENESKWLITTSILMYYQGIMLVCSAFSLVKPLWDAVVTWLLQSTHTYIPPYIIVLYAVILWMRLLRTMWPTMNYVSLWLQSSKWFKTVLGISAVFLHLLYK